MLDSLAVYAVKTSTSAVRKIFTVTPSDSHATPEPIPDDVPTEVVSTFQYLGSTVQDDSGSTPRSSLKKASKAFQSLSCWHTKRHSRISGMIKAGAPAS